MKYPELKLVTSDLFTIEEERLCNANEHSRPRQAGLTRHKSIHLDECCSWKIIRDDYGALCLIAYTMNDEKNKKGM